MKNGKIQVALPKNTAMAKDLSQFTDALELQENEKGIFRSPECEVAEFTRRRTADIADNLFDPDGNIDMGIMGVDTYFEASPGSSLPEILRINAGEEVRMQLLAREEDVPEDGKLELNALGVPRSVLTSYKALARSFVLPALIKYYGQYFVAREGRGQIEAMLRNRDYPNSVFALDVVKSGKTSQDYGLKPFGSPILTSLPKLFTRPVILSSLKTVQKAQWAIDVRRTREFIIQKLLESGTDFELSDAYTDEDRFLPCPWTPPGAESSKDRRLRPPVWVSDFNFRPENAGL